jgi:CDP-diglyceride synthetase
VQHLLRVGVRVVFVLGTILIIGLALFPDLDLPTLRHWRSYSDIVYHVVGFSVLTALAVTSTNRTVLAMLTMALLATILEFLQILVPGREVWMSDLIASLSGVALGAFLAQAAAHLYQRLTHRRLGAFRSPTL